MHAALRGQPWASVCDRTLRRRGHRRSCSATDALLAYSDTCEPMLRVRAARPLSACPTSNIVDSFTVRRLPWA